MRVLVTGAAGFVGKKLLTAMRADPALRLAGHESGTETIDEIVAFDVATPDVKWDGAGARVIPVAGDLSHGEDVRPIFDEGIDLVVHLAAVVSGEAEEDFDLGYRVNLDGTRILLESCRQLSRSGRTRTPPVFVYASSTAVYGGDLPDTVPDDLRLVPATSYGAQKTIGELLVSDYSRKGFVDGRALRFPTVIVRPGAPNRALSSFISSIVRDPLQGDRAFCPVDDSVPVFVTSIRTLVRNILRAASVPADILGLDRAMTLPGLRVTVGEMISALRDVAGEKIAARIDRKADPLVVRVVSGWPGNIAATRARALGFGTDVDVREIIREFIQDELGGMPFVAN